MAENITLKITLDAVNATQSIKELKQLIKDSTNEALKFREGTAEFTRFSNVAAQAKDKLQAVREQMTLLDPDAKIRAFTSLGNAIVGGFAAAQGAAALLGANVEDVQKAMLKVQSAMALLQGFQAIQDGIKAFSAMRAMVLLTTASMTALQGAIAATGIGALAVAIGILVVKLNEQKRATEEAAKAQEDYNARMQEAAQYAKFLSDARTQGARIELEAAKARGESLEKLLVLERALVNTQLQGLEEVYKAETDVSRRDALLLQKRELQAQLELLDINYHNRIKERNQQAAEQRFELERNTNAARMEEVQRAVDAIAQIEIVAMERSTEAASMNFMKRITDRQTFNRLDLEEAKSLADAKQQIEQATFATITNLGNTFIKNQQKLEQFNKKVAAVQMIISQAKALASAIEGASAAAAAAGPAAPFVLIANIATAVAAITGIFASVKGLLSRAGGSTGTSLDTGGVSAPSASAASNVPSGVNLLEQPSTTLNSGGNNGQPQQPIIIQNIISESEISGVQAGVNAIVTQATIN